MPSALPALALVAAWFAFRRRHEAVQLSVRLEHNVAQLQEQIRRRRELQEQLREAYQIAAVGTVAGGLAHELNDVLQPIVTLSQLHADRPDTPEPARSGMRHIHEAAERGRDIVKHTLSFTTGGIHDTEEVVPSRWLGDFVARARESTAGAVTFATEFGSDAGSVRVNAGELEHVMDNLLANAVEAMQRRGTVTVTLDACTLDAEGARGAGPDGGRFLPHHGGRRGSRHGRRSTTSRVRSVLYDQGRDDQGRVPPREAATDRAWGSPWHTGWCAAGRATSRCAPSRAPVRRSRS